MYVLYNSLTEMFPTVDGVFQTATNSDKLSEATCEAIAGMLKKISIDSTCNLSQFVPARLDRFAR
jgi:hypothetical protein